MVETLTVVALCGAVIAIVGLRWRRSRLLREAGRQAPIEVPDPKRPRE